VRPGRVNARCESAAGSQKFFLLFSKRSAFFAWL
jgi:hypothetical protein